VRRLVARFSGGFPRGFLGTEPGPGRCRKWVRPRCAEGHGPLQPGPERFDVGFICGIPRRASGPVPIGASFDEPVHRNASRPGLPTCFPLDTAQSPKGPRKPSKGRRSSIPQGTVPMTSSLSRLLSSWLVMRSRSSSHSCSECTKCHLLCVMGEPCNAMNVQSRPRRLPSLTRCHGIGLLRAGIEPF
jgi:hypothetical protein